MPRIPLFIVSTLVIITVLLCWATSSKLAAIGSNTGLTRYRFVDVEIFSKEKDLKSIDIKSNVISMEVKKSLFSRENWHIKSGKMNLTAYNNNLSLNFPNKITLMPLGKNPICIGINGKLKSNRYTRCYSGNVEMSSNDGKLKLINHVPVLDYLYSTVGSEILPGCPEEAVKAQVVVVNTYLLYSLTKNVTLKDTTQNQFYGGVTYENKPYKQYINEVKNIVMVDKNNEPIEALYHSTCAGETLNNEDVFGGKPKHYLKSVKCLYDKDSNFYNPKIIWIYKDTLKKIFHTSQLKLVRNKTGKLSSIITDNKTYSPYQFWIILGNNIGWGKVPGIKFEINCFKDKCKITSRGAGHAVGLCQWGARGMALVGFNYKQILQYYYKDVKLK